MTLLQVIRIIETAAASQPSVNMIVRDNVLKLNSAPGAKYGAFVWTQGQHGESTDLDWRTWRFTLFYIDRVTRSRSNVTEIQSVGIETLSNVIRQLAETFDVLDWTYDTFTQRFADECAGAWASVTFRAPLGDTCPEEYAVGDFSDDFNADFKDTNVMKIL